MRKVLFIEDDNNQKKIIKGWFARSEIDLEFYELNSNTTLSDIIDYFFENNFQLLVADHDLAKIRVDFDGAELVEALHERCIHYPVLILTAYQNDAVSKSNYPVFVQQRPNLRAEWEVFVEKVKKAVDSFEKRIKDTEDELVKLAKKEKLTRNEQVRYATLSNFLTDIEFPEKDLASLVSPSGFSTKLGQIVESLQNIERVLERSDV